MVVKHLAGSILRPRGPRAITGEARIPLSELPPPHAALLSAWDRDGSGSIAPSELAEAVHLLVTSRRRHFAARCALGLLGVLLLMCFLIGAMWAVVRASKDATVTSTGALVSSSSGALVSVNIHQTTVELPISAFLSRERLVDLQHIALMPPADAAPINASAQTALRVLGFVTQPSSSSPALTLVTDAGNILFEGRSLSAANEWGAIALKLGLPPFPLAPVAMGIWARANPYSAASAEEDYQEALLACPRGSQGACAQATVFEVIKQ